MAKSNHRIHDFGGDSRRFPEPFPDELHNMPRCFWPGCKDESWMGLCFLHAIDVYNLVRKVFTLQGEETKAEFDAELEARGMEPSPPRAAPKRPAYVYYLMVGPTTVKIGTTSNLPQRLAALRTDLQYVVAIERGGQALERQRHKEFTTERFGKREDFQLSERLKHHIEALQANRDELIGIATQQASA